MAAGFIHWYRLDFFFIHRPLRLHFHWRVLQTRLFHRILLQGPSEKKKKETKSNHGNEIYGNISLHVNTLSSKRKQHIIVDVDVFILRNDWRKTAGRSFPWRIELKLDGVSVLVGFFDRLWSAGSLPWHFLLLLLSLDFFFCVVFFCFFLFFFYRTKTQLTFGDRWVVRVTGEAFDALRQNERMKIHL